METIQIDQPTVPLIESWARNYKLEAEAEAEAVEAVVVEAEAEAEAVNF